jgi:hypothetical protein
MSKESDALGRLQAAVKGKDRTDGTAQADNGAQVQLHSYANVDPADVTTLCACVKDEAKHRIDATKGAFISVGGRRVRNLTRLGAIRMGSDGSAEALVAVKVTDLDHLIEQATPFVPTDPAPAVETPPAKAAVAAPAVKPLAAP